MKIALTCNKNAFVSKTIRYFEASKARPKPKFSHTFPILGDLGKITWGLSADYVMVNVVDLADYRKDGVYFEVWDIPDNVDPDERNGKLLKRFNQEWYGHVSLPWFVYRWWKRLTNPKWTGKNWATGGSFCSEVSYVALVYNNNTIQDADANTIDPCEIGDFIAQIPGAKCTEVWGTPP
jgi:hypothetical protein